MKVQALKADFGGCALYRIDQPARCVNALDAGVSVVVDTGLDVEASKDSSGFTTTTRVNIDADVLVIQRPLDHSWIGVIEQCRRQGITTVVEIDDDFTCLDTGNNGWKHVQPHLRPLANHQWLSRAAEAADWVTVSTPRLARVYAPHGRVSVLRNYIDSAAFDVEAARPRPANEPVRLGWTGSLQTHPRDLEVTRPGVAQAVRDSKAAFRVVGDGAGVRNALGLRAATDFRDTGWVKLERYYQRIIDTIDVGIVPLADTPFNEAKSALKMMEFASLGIPSIGSPSSENTWLHENYGIGLLARSPSEWRTQIEIVLADPRWTADKADEDRQTIRNYLSAQEHAPQWVQAWEKAGAVRR